MQIAEFISINSKKSDCQAIKALLIIECNWFFLIVSWLASMALIVDH